MSSIYHFDLPPYTISDSRVAKFFREKRNSDDACRIGTHTNSTGIIVNVYCITFVIIIIIVKLG